MKKAAHASNEQRRRLDTTCLLAEISQLHPPELVQHLRTALIGTLPEQCKTMKNLESIANNSETARIAVLELHAIYLRYLKTEILNLQREKLDLQREHSNLQMEHSKQSDGVREMLDIISRLKMQFPFVHAQISSDNHGNQDQSQMNLHDSCSSQHTPNRQAGLPYRDRENIPQHDYSRIQPQSTSIDSWASISARHPSPEPSAHHVSMLNSPLQHTALGQPLHASIPGYDNTVLIQRCVEIAKHRLLAVEQIYKEQEQTWIAREGQRAAKKMDVRTKVRGKMEPMAMPIRGGRKRRAS